MHSVQTAKCIGDTTQKETIRKNIFTRKRSLRYQTTKRFKRLHEKQRNNKNPTFHSTPPNISIADRANAAWVRAKPSSPERTLARSLQLTVKTGVITNFLMRSLTAFLEMVECRGHSRLILLFFLRLPCLFLFFSPFLSCTPLVPAVSRSPLLICGSCWQWDRVLTSRAALKLHYTVYAPRTVISFIIGARG